MLNRWHSLFAALPLVAAAAVAACGGSAPPAETPSSTADAGAPTAAPTAAAVVDASAPAAPTAEATPTPPPAPTAVKFDDLSKEKKVDVMVSKVVPNVGKLFKEHDAKKWAKFDCTTCHGPTKKQAPQDVLPKLTLSNGGFEKLAKAKPGVVKWMTAVEEQMAADLGETPYDPQTHKGFGCGGCHKVQ